MIDAAFAAMVRERAGALFIGPDPFFNTRRVQLANMAAHHSIPTASAVREYVDAGGLMSYGTNLADMFRQAGVGQAGRSAGAAIDQVRAGHQRPDRENARPHRAGGAAQPCRRGDRMRILSAVQESGFGTCPL